MEKKSSESSEENELVDDITLHDSSNSSCLHEDSDESEIATTSGTNQE